MKKNNIKTFFYSLFLIAFFLLAAKINPARALETFMNVNLKCNCTNSFSTCGNRFERTNIKWRSCPLAVTGAQTCTYATGTVSSPTLWQVVDCGNSPTNTPIPPTPTGTNTCVPFKLIFDNDFIDWKDPGIPGSSINTGTSVKMTIPFLTPAPISFKQRGITTIKKIRGNFAAEVISKLSSATAGKKEGSASFVVASTLGNRIISITRLPGQEKLRWYYKIATQDQQGDVSVDGLLNNKEIKLRITRINGVVKMQYKMDDAPYKLLKQVDNFPNVEMEARLTVGTTSPDFPAVSGTFDGLRVTCPITTDVTPTITPTVTPLISLTPTPTGVIPSPTINPLCICNSSNNCADDCSFDKFTTGVTYPVSIKCVLPVTLFSTAPSDDDKTNWCRRPKKTKGDANSDDNITNLDYMYYVSAVNGGKIPPTVNPDFNGDGEVGSSDRDIVISSL